MKLEWIDDPSSVPELVDLFLRCAGAVYICQGELLDGRADTPSSWSGELPVVLAREFSEAIESGRSSRDRDVGRSGGILAALIDGKAAGFALVELRRPPGSRPYAFLHDIVVDPSARGRGIGSALMTRLREEFRSSGIDRVLLESGIGNLRAHAFFERHGFIKLSVSMAADLGSARAPPAPQT